MGRMSFLFVTVALALGVALVSGGSLRRIAATELRHSGILAVAVGIQLALEVLHPTRGTAGHLASALLVVSYVFLLAVLRRQPARCGAWRWWRWGSPSTGPSSP